MSKNKSKINNSLLSEFSRFLDNSSISQQNNNNKQIQSLKFPQLKPQVIKNTTSGLPHRFKHRELVYQLRGADYLQLQTDVTPTNEQMFPWLSQISHGFEGYEIKNMKFEYVAQAAFTQSGMIYAALDYDSADVNAALTPSEITQMKGCVSTSILTPFSLKFSHSDAKRKNYFTLPLGGQPNFTAVQDYVPAKLNIIISGVQDQLLIGNIYVEYDIQFKTPQPYYVTTDDRSVKQYSRILTQENSFSGNSVNWMDFIEQAPSILVSKQEGKYAPVYDPVTKTYTNESGQDQEGICSIEFSGPTPSGPAGLVLLQTGKHTTAGVTLETLQGVNIAPTDPLPWAQIASGLIYVAVFKYIMPKYTSFKFNDHASVVMSNIAGAAITWLPYPGSQ